jgi:serine/threonine protein kinase
LKQILTFFSGANILLSNNGQVMIGDYGMARKIPERRTQLTDPSRVVTMWYRAPELLLGCRDYSFAVDIWSLGFEFLFVPSFLFNLVSCIFAEIFIGTPLFKGKNEVEQLEFIFKVCGTPSDRTWKDFSKLPDVRIAPLSIVFPRCLKDEFLEFVLFLYFSIVTSFFAF